MDEAVPAEYSPDAGRDFLAANPDQFRRRRPRWEADSGRDRPGVVQAVHAPGKLGAGHVEEDAEYTSPEQSMPSRESPPWT